MTRLLRTLGFFCLVFPSFADYHFDSWTTDNGLPSNSIRALVQTRDGYLWLTTGNGLVRFDGVRFRVFDSGNTPGLISNRYTAFALREDNRGTLWAGTIDGGLVRYRDGVFKTFTTRDGLPNNRVLRIDEDAEGVIWIVTEEGLAQWKEERLVRVAPLPGSPFNDYLTPPRQYVGADGMFYGLWRRSSEGWQRFAYGRWSPFPLPSHLKSPEDLAISSIIEDSQRRVWYNLSHRQDEYYCVSDGKLSVYKGIPRGAFIMYQDRRGFFWLTDHDAHTSLWKEGHLMPLKELATPTIFRILEDREGGLWVGTLNEGLYHLKQQVITSFRHHSGPEIRPTLLSDDEGNIWVGGFGLAQYKDSKFSVFIRRPSDGWPSNVVTALYEDRDGTLWVGFGNGAEQFRNGRFFEDRSVSLRIQSRVNAIHRDRSGILWFGCEDGLYSFDNNKITRYTREDGLADTRITALLEDRQGRLWVGSRQGMSSFDHARGLASIPQLGEVVSLYEDSSGVVWVGTNGRGLFRMEGDKLTHYTTEQGLTFNSASQILEDDAGFLWIGTQTGLFRIAKRDLNEVAAGRLKRVTSTHFGKADGLLTADFERLGQPGSFKTKEGKLWFSFLGGFAVVNPKTITSHSVPPPVSIEECIIERKSIGCSDRIVMEPGQTNLEVQYTGLSFVKPDQFQFKYKMDGLDGDWTEAGTRRSAYYSHIPPGEYNFQVIAANSDGIWNANAKSLRVIVQPPFYATWWFRTMAVLCAAGLITLAWRYRVTQMERSHAAQQAFTRQLISSQERERKRIAAELHDSLGQRLVVIKNLALMSLKNVIDEATGRQIGEISSEASQALGEVKEISYNLRPYQLDRIGLTKAVDSLVKTIAAASHIAITAEIDKIDELFPKELEINFYRIVQEGLNNIVKHSEATEARVAVQREANRLQLTIWDNGRGFTPGAATNQSDGGFGLPGIYERGQLLGGKTVIHSTPGQGTTVTVEIPVVRERRAG